MAPLPHSGILLPGLDTHDLRWVRGYGRLGTYPMKENKEGALPATRGGDCSLGEGSGGRG